MNEQMTNRVVFRKDDRVVEVFDLTVASAGWLGFYFSQTRAAYRAGWTLEYYPEGDVPMQDAEPRALRTNNMGHLARVIGRFVMDMEEGVSTPYSTPQQSA